MPMLGCSLQAPALFEVVTLRWPRAMATRIAKGCLCAAGAALAGHGMHGMLSGLRPSHTVELKLEEVAPDEVSYAFWRAGWSEASLWTSNYTAGFLSGLPSTDASGLWFVKWLLVDVAAGNTLNWAGWLIFGNSWSFIQSGLRIVAGLSILL
eukprot:915271-Amphidinium_carterae.6